MVPWGGMCIYVRALRERNAGRDSEEAAERRPDRPAHSRPRWEKEILIVLSRCLLYAPPPFKGATQLSTHSASKRRATRMRHGPSTATPLAKKVFGVAGVNGPPSQTDDDVAHMRALEMPQSRARPHNEASAPSVSYAFTGSITQKVMEVAKMRVVPVSLLMRCSRTPPCSEENRQDMRAWGT